MIARNSFLIGLLVVLNSVGFSQQVVPKSLNILIDQWHIDAANANFTSYFSAVSDQFVFLGTSPGERWEKGAFESFCKPYFDKGKAWDFKPSERFWMFSADKKRLGLMKIWLLGWAVAGVVVFANS